MRRLAALLERPLRPPVVAITPRDAIVIPGAPVLPSGAMSDILAERVAAAVELYRAGAAPLVVATGGLIAGSPRAEAVAIAEGLRAAGLPTSAILVESTSRTTAENARFTIPLLPCGARVWVVTQPFHARRATRCFRAAGFDAAPVHIATSIQYSQRRRAVKWLVREYAAWVKHLLRQRG